MSAVFEGLPVKSVSVENMVAQREAVMQRFKDAIALLSEARDIANAAGVGFPRLKLDENRYSVYDMLDPDPKREVFEKIAKIIDSGGWQHLMSESGMRSLMDARAREEWDKSICEGKFPEFTLKNILSTFQSLHGSRDEIFERGVLAVFKSLAWCYKTNRPFAFGKRIVITHLRGEVTGSGNSLGHVNHNSTNQLDDLVRVFSILDGKPEPDHRGGMYYAVGHAKTRNDPDVDTEYLQIRCFRNGNGHILFKRPDLVEKMNKILTKHFPGALAHDKNPMARP